MRAFPEFRLSPAASSIAVPQENAERWAAGDPAGVSVAGWQAGDQPKVYIPDLALYVYDTETNVVSAGVVSSSIRDDDVLDAYFGFVLPLFLQSEGAEVLHASAVLAGRDVVALCGRSGTGKSTLATSLMQRGYGIWADDAVVWTASKAGAITFPLPFRRRAANAGARAPAQSAGSHPRALKAVLVLERVENAEESGEVVIGPVQAASALKSVLPHAYAFSLSDERRRRDFVSRYVHLAATVPVVRVRFHHDLRRLGSLRDTCERVLDSICAGGAVLAS